MSNVIVLMSSYNGARFLNEQLQSILDQDFDGNITVLIRDDGSKDTTLNLIRRVKQSDTRTLEVIEGKNLGPQRSFLALIQLAGDADYFFFADQDDIWYPDKIQRGVDALRKCDGPACFTSNYDIYNSDLEQKRERVLKERPPFRPLKIIFYNQIPGCAMGFNRQLMNALKNVKLSNVMMHDSMTLAFAAAIGEVLYDEQPGIAHRIHGDNVVGEGHKKIVLHKWLVEKIGLVLHKEDYNLSEMAGQFLASGRVKKTCEEDLLLLRDYKKSWVNTMRLLKHPDSHDVFLDRTTLSIRSKILLHLF